jgi:hypothetical protein
LRLLVKFCTSLCFYSFPKTGGKIRPLDIYVRGGGGGGQITYAKFVGETIYATFKSPIKKIGTWLRIKFVWPVGVQKLSLIHHETFGSSKNGTGRPVSANGELHICQLPFWNWYIFLKTKSFNRTLLTLQQIAYAPGNYCTRFIRLMTTTHKRVSIIEAILRQEQSHKQHSVSQEALSCTPELVLTIQHFRVKLCTVLKVKKPLARTLGLSRSRR